MNETNFYNNEHALIFFEVRIECIVTDVGRMVRSRAIIVHSSGNIAAMY